MASASNPYTPPRAPVKDAPPPPRSPFVAVLVGLGVDIGGTFLSSIIVGIVYAVMLAARGADPGQIQTTLTVADPSSGYFMFSTVIGLGFSLLGGYICARLARRNELRLTAIMAALIAAVGLVLGGVALGAWLNVLMILLTFVSVMAGGELGRRRNVAQAREASAAAAV